MFSVCVKEHLTDCGVVIHVFGEPLLGEPLLCHGLLIELDERLCEEVVVGLITCGREAVVLGTRLLSGSAPGCCLLNLKDGEEQKEVLEAIDDEEKESEVGGEVEERVTQRVHET